MRIPISRGSWWGLLIPVALLALLWVAINQSPSEAPVPSSAAVTAVFTPTFNNLPVLPNGHYELWVQQAGGGVERFAAFTVGAGGGLFSLSGEAMPEMPLGELPVPGSTFTVTAEAGTVLADRPGKRAVLAGSLAQTQVEFKAPEFPHPRGNEVMLLAPTDPGAPDTSGLWFAKPTKVKGSPKAGLTLPAAPEGWVYGSFVTTAAGSVLPLGAFHDPAAADDKASFSGAKRPLSFPGEDFVVHPPEGVTFPLNLADGRTEVVVSLLPDFAADADAPYLVLLKARIPYQREAGNPFGLEPVADDSFPSGSGTFIQRVSEGA